MSQSVSTSVRRWPVLLLLGLLALLLWGQCGLRLYPRKDIERPPLGCTVFSVDSLHTAPPAMLYLTLSLHNEFTQPVVVQKVTGTLQLERHSYSFTATAASHTMPLGKDATAKQAVAIPLRIRVDSLALVRQRLEAGSSAANSLRLSLGIYYSTKPDPQNLLDRYSAYYLYLPPLSPRP